jgi:hypothetical protein
VRLRSLGYRFRDPHGRWTAHGYEPTNPGDAALITAAPELLATLEAVLTGLTEWAAATDDTARQTRAVRLAHAMQQARTTLSKARGGT